ncbi:DNA-processing protein DprA [Porphyromonas canoris]|uniref:DNA-processing protein DprA n=1 Tax=Porphyromonas canoris TaxID=36875 RepID=UPI00068D80A6|nr:DNA-processing protein DprA [Porphyromonas canoris]
MILTEEQKALLALSCVDGVGPVIAHSLLDLCGSATDIWNKGKEELLRLDGVGPKLASAIYDGQALLKAQEELDLLRKNDRINLCFSSDDVYPALLKGCVDAPLLLYYYGKLPEPNAPWISIVGSRSCTGYGESMVDKIVKAVAESNPNAVIVSGLAYGIDILAHRAALKYGLKTLAVLAHGLHTLYPAVHRRDAENIIQAGGAVITEYPYYTKALPARFLARNRIIAGLSHATVVVESATKGGSLVTADLAFSYSRSVFAVPGRVGDMLSSGCNELISQQKASIFCSAEEMLTEIGWDSLKEGKSKVIQQSIGIFADIPEELKSSRYYSLLKEREECTMEDISLILGIPIHVASAELFELELNGYLRSKPGGIYELESQYR